MARKTVQPVEKPAVTPKQGISLIRKQISEGERLLAVKDGINESDYDHWQELTKDAAERAFGKNSEKVRKITEWANEPPLFGMGSDLLGKTDPSKEMERRVEAIQAQVKLLNTALATL